MIITNKVMSNVERYGINGLSLIENYWWNGILLMFLLSPFGLLFDARNIICFILLLIIINVGSAGKLRNTSIVYFNNIRELLNINHCVNRYFWREMK